MNRGPFRMKMKEGISIIPQNNTQEDYDSFDEIYVMDHENLRTMHWIVDDYDRKVRMLTGQEIEDPWYTDRFDEVFEQIRKGIEEIL